LAISTIKRFLAHLGDDAPVVQAESVLKLEFANGSRVLALPGSEKTIRGIAGAALVVIDEASRVEDELLAAVRPRHDQRAADRADYPCRQARLLLRRMDRDRRLDAHQGGSVRLSAHQPGILGGRIEGAWRHAF
jgi:hypothetical protein